MKLFSLFKSKKKSSFSPLLCPLPHCGNPKTLSFRVENNHNIFNSQRFNNNVDNYMVEKVIEGLKIEKGRFFFEAGAKTSSILEVSSSTLSKSNNSNSSNGPEYLPFNDSCVITPMDPYGEETSSIREVSSTTLSKSNNSTSSNGPKYVPFNDSCVIRLSSSRDPYGSFKKSMEKMVEANQEIKDWEEYLEEILAWYLEVNEKDIHKYIIGAFCDLWISYSSTSTTNTPNSFINSPFSFSSSAPPSPSFLSLIEAKAEIITTTTSSVIS